MQSGIVENPLNEWRFTASVSPQGALPGDQDGGDQLSDGDGGRAQDAASRSWGRLR